MGMGSVLYKQSQVAVKYLRRYAGTGPVSGDRDPSEPADSN